MDWEKIDKWIIYVGLGIVGVLEFISDFIYIPFLTNSVPVTILCVVLIILVKDGNVITKLNNGFDIDIDAFAESTNKLLSMSKTISSMDLFVYTGARYRTRFEESDIKINHLRILLRKPTQNDPKYIEELERELKIFYELKNNGNIKNLEIRFYDFEPMLFFCIINDTYINFGTIKPYRLKYKTVTTAYLLKKSSNRILVEDYKKQFDYIFEISDESFDKK